MVHNILINYPFQLRIYDGGTSWEQNQAHHGFSPVLKSVSTHGTNTTFPLSGSTSAWANAKDCSNKYQKKKSINMQRKVIHPHSSYVSDVQGTRIFGNHKGIQIAKFLKNILNHIKHWYHFNIEVIQISKSFY